MQERVWCNFKQLLSCGEKKRNLFWHFFPSNSMVFTCMDILYNHIHQVDGSKWHAAFEWTLQNVRQTCLSTNTTCLNMLIRSALTKSDTNGGYRQFLGGLWSVNRLNRLWKEDRKRALLRLFRPCTLPKCSSTTTMYHVQPTTNIHWDWNNVYRVGRSYHFNCMHMHHCCGEKWASNCQNLPGQTDDLTHVKRRIKFSDAK